MLFFKECSCFSAERLEFPCIPFFTCYNFIQILKSLSLLFYVLARLCDLQDLSSWPGIEAPSPASEAWSLNHWATRDVPTLYSFLYTSGEVWAILSTFPVLIKHNISIILDTSLPWTSRSSCSYPLFYGYPLPCFYMYLTNIKYWTQQRIRQT